MRTGVQALVERLAYQHKADAGNGHHEHKDNQKVESDRIVKHQGYRLSVVCGYP